MQEVTPISLVLVIAGVIAIGMVTGMVLCSYSFDRSVEREVSDMAAGAETALPKALFAETIEQLPEPVQQYLAYAIPAGTPPVRFVRMKQTGEFRTDPAGAWMPLEAEQYFSAGFPGFIWHARIRFASVLRFDVRDSFDGAKGNMLVKILSTVPIADAKGPEIDASSLHRYIGEMPWFPTAFLNEEYITWEPIDSSRARAIITDGNRSVSVEFSFDEAGRITRVTTDERYRSVGDRFVRDRWTGYYRDYREQNGLNVPMELMAEWNLPGGDFSYVRLRATEIEYDVFSPY